MICLRLSIVSLPVFRDKRHLDLPSSFVYIPSCYTGSKDMAQVNHQEINCLLQEGRYNTISPW